MDKKLELLAKTLMDASKIMFVSVFATYLINSNQIDIDYEKLLLVVLFVMIIGYIGWMVHPTVTEKGEQ